MATLQHSQRTVDGVALVHLTIETDVPERVTVETDVDGPIWPPRTRGVPEAGWSEAGWAGRVEPDRPRALGFATADEVEEPPARIVETAPAESAPERDVDARELVRTLGRPGPPRDAVPVGDEAGDPVSGASNPAGGEANATDTQADSGPETSSPAPIGDHEPSLSAVEDRIATAERLTGADSLAGAEDALDREAPTAAVRRLLDRLEVDRRRLQAGADRRRELAARIAAVDVSAERCERER